MIRKYLALATAVLLACAGTASATRLVPSAGAQQTVIRDAPECGGRGFSMLLLTGSRHRFACVHTAGDVFDPTAAARAMALGSRPAVAKVPCYGDGTTGPRIQMIYGYYDGIPNRLAEVTRQFRNELAPRMQAVINGQADGHDLGLRFLFTTGCKAIDIKAVKFPRSVQDGGRPGDPGDQIDRAASYLYAHGYNRDDRKYQIMWDGWNYGACGIAFLAAGAPIFSTPVAPLSDGVPTLGGHTDPGTVFRLGATNVSMIFNHAGGPHGGSCFASQGLSTVTPEVHELFHNLGAVQLDAPHANTGHCDDAPSVMCPGGGPGYGGGINNPSCAKVLVETLDCGEDDYWNPNPRPDSYLATHLNIAKSQFFGHQPADYLTASPV